MNLPANSLRRAISILGAVAFTAGAYFASSGLHRIWWLAWLAPLPVLLLAPRLRAWEAFVAALFARGIAALSFWSYDRHIVQLSFWFSLAALLVPAVFFALAVIFNRGLLKKEYPWLAVLAFPVTIVATEYLLSLSQGTFLSTGYTQLKNLPVLQLAAITGLWGISFTVNLFPAGVAAVFSGPAKLPLRMAVVLIAFFICVLGYGMTRLNAPPQAHNSIRVGLVETHAGPNYFPPDAQATMASMQEYAMQVQPLAARGAQFVVFPEMSALVPELLVPQVDTLMERAAYDGHVQILLGILHATDHGVYNEGRLYSATGDIETVYRKHHPVPTWEARTTPGTELSVLASPRRAEENRGADRSSVPEPEGKIGIEICRDMDYPELARRYGKQQVGLVLVPAWDQGLDVDADWHGHLSLMRGVEDGFTIVRDAKVGFLTASDDRGRILAEEPTRSDGAMTTMLATVPVRHDSTLYQDWGDWFAWLDLAALVAMLTFSVGIQRLSGTPAK